MTASAQTAPATTTHGEQAARLVALVRAVDGCSQALRGAVEAIAARHELNATQLLALWACGEASAELAQSELAARIGVSAAQASALVEQLRRRNLLEPRRAADDRRKQNWSITAEGRTLISQVVEKFAALGSRAESMQDERQTLAVVAALDRIRSAVETPHAECRLRVFDHDAHGGSDSSSAVPEVRR